MEKGRSGLDKIANSMNKKHILLGFAIGVTVLCLIGWAVATHPPSPPTQSLAFATAFQSRKGTDWRKYMVTVSNTTAYTVEYGKGFNKLWFEIAYASNGVWMTTNVTTPGVESCFLLPHAVLTDSIFVPGDSGPFKIGLHITSLTWRGRFAVSSAHSRYLYRLKDFTGLLLVQDQRRRSST